MPPDARAPDTVAPDTFKEAMSLLAAHLTVVTARDTGGRAWGFTASSVTSVSLDPPLVSVGISHTSSCHPALSAASEFVVNVLGHDHQDLARRFAAKDTDRFAGANHDNWPGSATPLLTDVPVAWRCAVENRITVGDHDLVIGRLIALRRHDRPATPLVWYQRDYARISG
jgi:flavin reductase ActVB